MFLSYKIDPIALRIQMMGVFVEIALLPSSDRHCIAPTCAAFLELSDRVTKGRSH
ncbi:hypothetical protein K9N68_24695 [Kovacikia minuta CCNUW1]|uniref:hypothetical protein n=1 Tax=Kovacikia minuta TaxID=2931930 RepID=UPI001CCDB75D|nr:hypothetical protein [Kovacikia minuta]UBF24828.1 hypothetical protein K9N68_24695 [Kovacikia minuta CCNUW1]